MSEAFFEPLGDGRFRATELTTGPWSPQHQHGGPTAALLGDHLATVPGGDAKRVARVSFDILSPIPVATLSLSAEVVRPGRRVDLVEGAITVDDEPVVIARAWRHAVSEIEVPAGAREAAPPPPPEEGRHTPFFDVPSEVGYHTAMEWRAVEGGFHELGPAMVWLRPTVSVVPDEPVTPLQRVLLAADSGNGISAAADPRSLLFVNTELTVHLHRHGHGDWVGMRSTTTFAPDGVGLAVSEVFDEHGGLGRAAQALFVEAR